MKNLILIVISLVTSLPLFSQSYWANNTSSPMTNEAIDIEIDGSGNQYVAGYISGGTNFASGVTGISSSGNNDIYVSKYDPTGAFLWVKKFGGTFSDRPTDLAIDNAGNILVTGQYFGQVTFGSTILNSVGTSKDIFIVKLDNAGDVIWAKSEGGSGSENAYGIATDNLNNVILTGQFQGTSVIGGQNFISMTDPILGSANYDLFISKYNSSGTPIWVKTGVAKYEERGFAVDCDASNNILITGQFSDTFSIASQTFNNISYNVGFLAKFNPTGSLQWLHQMKAGVVLPYDLEVTNTGNVFVTGDFTGNLNYYTATSLTTITNPYQKKVFVIKTDNNGLVDWTKAFGSRNEVSSRSISIDNSQNTFITGYFKCDFSQFHDGATATYNSAGFKDAYLIKLNSLGEMVYSKTFGSQKEDQGHGVAILSTQLPVVAGSYEENFYIPTTSSTAYVSGTGGFGLNYSFSTGFANLLGDNTPNSFITNAIHAGTPNYNYFISQPVDSLFGNIMPNTDTLDICGITTLVYDPKTPTYPTTGSNGPTYNYLWSNGSTNQNTQVLSTGTYTVQVEREDGCSAGGDTIHIIYHVPPPLPLLTDDHGIGMNTSAYPLYVFCAPETIGIEFSNLCSGCTMQVGNSPVYTDTLIHFYSQTGIYPVSVSDAFCTTNSYFEIILQNPLPYDTIVPYISFVEDFNHDDSIVVCNDQIVHIHIYDYITNPTEIADSFNIQPMLTSYMNSPQVGIFSGSDDYHFHFEPTTSGWYHFNYYGTLGYDNLCGLDTAIISSTDSVYITVNTIDINANDLLCPDGSVYLYIDTVISNLVWTGPGIEWTSPNNDSVQVSQAGSYSLSGIFTDTLSGCVGPFMTYFTLQEKVPPTISMFPTDGIICPGDSVTFSLPNVYTSYEWVNPDGFTISTSNTAHDGDQGFYYCHVTDSSGCTLTTLPVEIKEFTSPSLNVLPTNVICLSEPVTINVNYDGNASISWINPIYAGSSDEIIVNQPGIYICEINQCGLTYIDSIEIYDGSFSVTLSTTDSILCYGDTAIVSVNSGLSEYIWSNGSTGMSSIHAYSAGDYFVTVVNQFGCEALSDTITIETVPFSFPPAIDDVVLCPGDDIILSDGMGTSINWYDSDFNLITNSIEFSITNLLEDSTVLAAYDVVGCPPAYETVLVSIAPPLSAVQLIGDTLLCAYSLGELSLSSSIPTIEWYVDGVGPSTDSVLMVIPNTTPQLVNVYFSNSCYNDSLSQMIYSYPASPISIAEDSLIACAYSDYLLESVGNFDSTIWTTNVGNFTTEDLQYDSTMGTGYIYVYGIDSNQCSSNVDSIWIDYSNPTFSIQASPFTCTSDTIELMFTTNATDLQWAGTGFTTDSNHISILVDSTNLGWMVIEATDVLNCSYTDSIELAFLPQPEIILPYDTILCLNEWIGVSSSGMGILYTWEGLQYGDSTPVIGSTWYYLTATNSFGCSVYDSVFIDAINCANSLPNVFSPNGDGINDYYIIDEALLFPNNELIIVNRWGEVVYQMKGYQNNWNGDDLVDGVYFVSFIQDRTDPNTRKLKSFVQLFRD